MTIAKFTEFDKFRENQKSGMVTRNIPFLITDISPEVVVKFNYPNCIWLDNY